MRVLRRDLALYAGLAIILVLAAASAIFVTSRAVDGLLRQDAESEGKAWARYLADNVADLGAIVAGAEPSPESRAFFKRAQQVGNVFLYKVYAPDGRLQLSSNARDVLDPKAESIIVHNPQAARTVLAGGTVVELHQGAAGDDDDEDEEADAESPGKDARPAFYSEAYLPVIADGSIIGIMEAYVDQSQKQAAFHARITTVALLLIGIIAIAFALPALGFTWRTRQKRLSDSQLAFVSDHDTLTETLNRARFMRDLEDAVALGCTIAVHVIDINGFKDINDTLGQAYGDDILKLVARRLRTLADRDNLLARLGSDDFALAEIVRRPRQITRTGRRVLAALGETFRVRGEDIELTASVGSAVAPMHGQSAADLLKSAEIALKHAKAEGHGTRSLFRPEMDTELKTRRALEALIRKAVASGSFELHYQPIVNAADRRLAGFEALLRLPDAAGRLVPPATFIPLAESLGLITEIGGWVIRRACMDAADWPSKLVIAVNLSPAQFEAGDLVPTVREALAVSGLPARRLELEITEGFLLSRSESVLAQLAELKALGVQIAMDDFGTGYSSLSYLWKFPFDKLKIDQSFARALGTDEHLPSVLEAIVALGRKLGMRVTAEGVETGPQADFLAGIGCDQLQGYYLSRPLPGARLPALILQDFRAATPQEEAAVARLQA